jgi:hypothetical protein
MSDVEKSLPPKKENIFKVGMYYRRALLEAYLNDVAHIKLLNRIM